MMCVACPDWLEQTDSVDSSAARIEEWKCSRIEEWKCPRIIARMLAQSAGVSRLGAGHGECVGGWVRQDGPVRHAVHAPVRQPLQRWCAPSPHLLCGS